MTPMVNTVLCGWLKNELLHAVELPSDCLFPFLPTCSSAALAMPRLCREASRPQDDLYGRFFPGNLHFVEILT
jgi:hypothetical protein